MRPTLEYLYTKFDYFNKLCFYGQLQRPIIQLSTRKGALGRTCCETDRDSGKKTVWIEISVRQNLPEEEYIDTLLHEMIHYYIQTNNLRDDAAHGSLFKAEMNRITATYGLRITIEYAPSEEELVNTISRWRYVCIATFNDGHKAVAVVAKNKLFYFWEVISSLPDLSVAEWYISDRAIFEQYPLSSHLRLFPIESVKIPLYLTGAKPLKKVGNIIQVVEP
ncbi:MAG: SprT-like domain-containing protein [Muribaculaceae bacterium]|nr:SprT-like domain-containing protein [Muribaculaceae bacterium]